MRVLSAVAAVTAAGAFALGYGAANLDPSGDPGSSAKRTIYSFVHAAKAQNFGRACSYMTADWASVAPACAKMDGARVVAGSETVVDEETVTYRVDFGDGYPPSTVTVKLQPSGKWRVTEVV